MGNAPTRAIEFAESVDEEASEFIQRLASQANTFANAAWLMTTPPSKPLAISEDQRLVAEQIYVGLEWDALNIGIFGGPGTGKLSLINALMEQPRSAAIPIASEDDGKVATQFAHPMYNHIRLWYLPDELGDEDTTAPGHYLERALYAFDIILILETGKIRPIDMDIVKEAISGDPPTLIAILRTKMDGALITGVGRVSDTKGWDKEKEKISRRLRSALSKQLHESDLYEIPVFLVSQAGVLDVMGKEPNDHRYVVDDYQLYNYLSESLQGRRYQE